MLFAAAAVPAALPVPQPTLPCDRFPNPEALCGVGAFFTYIAVVKCASARFGA